MRSPRLCFLAAATLVLAATTLARAEDAPKPLLKWSAVAPTGTWDAAAFKNGHTAEIGKVGKIGIACDGAGLRVTIASSRVRDAKSLAEFLVVASASAKPALSGAERRFFLFPPASGEDGILSREIVGATWLPNAKKWEPDVRLSRSVWSVCKRSATGWVLDFRCPLSVAGLAAKDGKVTLRYSASLAGETGTTSIPAGASAAPAKWTEVTLAVPPLELPTAPPETDDELRVLMGWRQLTLAFEEVPAAEALDTISTLLGIKIAVPEHVKELIDGQSLSLKIDATTAVAALETLLAAVDLGDDEGVLGYRYENAGVTITRMIH